MHCAGNFALCVATTIILREAPKKIYALVTLLPLAVVGTITLTAGVQSIWKLFLPMTASPGTRFTGWVNVVVTGILLVCVTMVIVGSTIRWWGLAKEPKTPETPETAIA